MHRAELRESAIANAPRDEGAKAGSSPVADALLRFSSVSRLCLQCPVHACANLFCCSIRDSGSTVAPATLSARVGVRSSDDAAQRDCALASALTRHSRVCTHSSLP
eukprot:3386142-Pleurochrysis_carterae.AAC.1